MVFKLVIRFHIGPQIYKARIEISKFDLLHHLNPKPRLTVVLPTWHATWKITWHILLFIISFFFSLLPLSFLSPSAFSSSLTFQPPPTPTSSLLPLSPLPHRCSRRWQQLLLLGPPPLSPPPPLSCYRIANCCFFGKVKGEGIRSHRRLLRPPMVADSCIAAGYRATPGISRMPSSYLLRPDSKGKGHISSKEEEEKAQI